ncbi:MAG: hypothetical protein NW701_18065 [Nitrospira sp.]
MRVTNGARVLVQQPFNFENWSGWDGETCIATCAETRVLALVEFGAVALATASIVRSFRYSSRRCCAAGDLAGGTGTHRGLAEKESWN